MGRIFQTYCLLVASILMLAVAVFPHHHHAERLCLKSDWCTCTSDASCEGHCTHSPNTDNHECTISCATHFAFGHQQLSRSDVSPDFTFSFLIYPMLSLLEYFQTGVIRIGNSDSIYIEKLHGGFVRLLFSFALEKQPGYECRRASDERNLVAGLVH